MIEATDLLDRALAALLALDSNTEIKPWPRALAREAALIAGLHGLAERYGRRLKAIGRIDAGGELRFVLDSSEGDQHYGPELASILSQVPRRTGNQPYSGPAYEFNNWCYINHFDVERMLRLLLAEG